MIEFESKHYPTQEELKEAKCKKYVELVRTKVIPLRALLLDMSFLNWWAVILHQQLPDNFINELIDFWTIPDIPVDTCDRFEESYLWEDLKCSRKSNNDILLNWMSYFPMENTISDPKQFYDELRKFVFDNVINERTDNPMRLLNNYINIIGINFVDSEILKLRSDICDKILMKKIDIDVNSSIVYSEEQLLKDYLSLQLVNWDEVSSKKLSLEFIEKFKFNLNWKELSWRFEYISNIEFLEKYESLLDWNIISASFHLVYVAGKERDIIEVIYNRFNTKLLHQIYYDISHYKQETRTGIN